MIKDSVLRSDWKYVVEAQSTGDSYLRNSCRIFSTLKTIAFIFPCCVKAFLPFNKMTHKALYK